MRRFLKALYNELTSWIEDHVERAGNLLMFAICYVEEFMTQYLDHLLVSMYKAILNHDNKIIMKRIPYCFQLLGRYVTPKSYGPLLIQAIRNELASFYQYTASGSLKAFGHIVSGSIEFLKEGMDLSHVEELLGNFTKAVEETVLDSMDIETANNLVYSLDILLEWLLKKSGEKVDVSAVKPHLAKWSDFVFRILSAYQIYKLQKKKDPEEIVANKAKCRKVMEMINKLSIICEGRECLEEGETPFFKNRLKDFIEESYLDLIKLYQEDLPKRAELEKQRLQKQAEDRKIWEEQQEERRAKAAEERYKAKENEAKQAENMEKFLAL